MSDDKLEFAVQSPLDDIRKATDKIEAQAKRYAEQMEVVSGMLKVQKIQRCPMGSLYSSVESHGTPGEARAALAKASAKAKAIYEQNKAASETNVKIHTAIMALMAKCGIPKCHHTYKTSRSRTTTKMKYAWVSEINSLIPTSFADPQSAYDSYERRIKEWEDKVEREQRNEEREVKAEQQRKESEQVLGFMAARYGYEVGADVNTVLEAIMGRNQHLRLSHFMALNRGDWSDGYSYAEQGLSSFRPQDARDTEIAYAVQAQITNWDGDGRCFRDMEWSYDDIMALVTDEQLLADYNAVNAIWQQENY